MEPIILPSRIKINSIDSKSSILNLKCKPGCIRSLTSCIYDKCGINQYNLYLDTIKKNLNEINMNLDSGNFEGLTEKIINFEKSLFYPSDNIRKMEICTCENCESYILKNLNLFLDFYYELEDKLKTNKIGQDFSNKLLDNLFFLIFLEKIRNKEMGIKQEKFEKFTLLLRQYNNNEEKKIRIKKIFNVFCKNSEKEKCQNPICIWKEDKCEINNEEILSGGKLNKYNLFKHYRLLLKKAKKRKVSRRLKKNKSRKKNKKTFKNIS